MQILFGPGSSANLPLPRMVQLPVRPQISQAESCRGGPPDTGGAGIKRHFPIPRTARKGVHWCRFGLSKETSDDGFPEAGTAGRILAQHWQSHAAAAGGAQPCLVLFSGRIDPSKLKKFTSNRRMSLFQW